MFKMSLRVAGARFGVPEVGGVRFCCVIGLAGGVNIPRAEGIRDISVNAMAGHGLKDKMVFWACSHSNTTIIAASNVTPAIN